MVDQRRIAGALLLIPAFLALLWSYVLPTLSTVAESFQRGTFLETGRLGGDGAGFDNYGRAVDDGLFGGYGTALLLALVPLFAALVAAPLLALAADRAGRAARIATRVLLALPLALYAPSAVSVGWFTDRLDGGSGVGARPATVSAYAWISFGLVVALAATAFLAALRGRRAGHGPATALLAVGGVLALGVLATALQAVTVPLMLATKAPPPVLYAVVRTVRVFDLGPGAAASVVLLLVLGVLGLAAVGLLLATRTRVEVEPEPASRRHPGAVAAVAVGGVVLLVIVGYALFPWLRDAADLGAGDLPPGHSTGRIITNTWLPPLVSAIVGVAFAAAGGYAIGALRPLGRASELILLPFAPWLFVGTGPLAVANFQRARDFEQVNTFLGLIPPTWLPIPALVLFTLYFRSRRSTVVTALPLAALALLLVWLASAQDLLWPLLVAQSPDMRTGPLALMIVPTLGGDSPMGLALPLPFVVFFAVAFVALQVGYLDRLAVRTGAEEPPGDHLRTHGDTTVTSRTK